MSRPSSTRGRTGDRADAAAGRITVGVGELAVTDDAAVLTTSGLGSCVAVAIVDERRAVRGLLHAMLPTAEASRTVDARPAKYVDAGVESLVDELRAAGASPAAMRARIAGGAEMLDLTEAVGPRNVERAERCLDAAGVRVVARDVGDAIGRTVRLRPDGRLVVRAADGFERTL
ncbi:chemotaxis protein CheD [Halorubrum sp. CBA1125]|uniref:chemotaxis protein CheD n=1 Tax=Halorubrum sp. CBA1125 TaxID=2668072 RepID=UPI00135ECE47|nr:chemotaxis protein CheD [Halorubrum sp. CBA1125]MUW15719.1 chemotaxis protein CheD [Halorubrum sp. CBA1125]